jgi:hypothetical protein
MSVTAGWIFAHRRDTIALIHVVEASDDEAPPQREQHRRFRPMIERQPNRGRPPTTPLPRTGRIEHTIVTTDGEDRAHQNRLVID